MERELEKVNKILQDFNTVEGQAISPVVINSLEQSWQRSGSIELLQFTCPIINAQLLKTEYPSDYILTNPRGNNFETGGLDIRLSKFLDAIFRVGAVPCLRIVIGDTDEDDYIFPVIGRPEKLDQVQCKINKELYAENFTTRIIQKFPSLKFSVERFSEIACLFNEDDLPIIDESYKLELGEDFDKEAGQMIKAFSLGGYYEGIDLPTTEQLDQIVDLKFRTYARQGFMLLEYYPQIVLLQNEFPLQVRTRMINILNRQIGRDLPVIYPYKERL